MSELAVTGNSFNSMYITRLTYMLQVKLNQVDTIFSLSPIPNYHKLRLGDIGNWESTEV